MNQLTALSPIDGRYWDRVSALSPFFSEFGLIKSRVRVEIAYFIDLSMVIPELKDVDKNDLQVIRNLYSNFTERDALRIKEIEKTTNHDVKAVEYWIKEKMTDSIVYNYSEFVHFGLTSQDINNTAIPLLLKDCMNNVFRQEFAILSKTLKDLATTWIDIPMLARTHGQPATPTRLGKEFMVFSERIGNQLAKLYSNYETIFDEATFITTAKFGGATGQFNAHKAAYPNIDWVKFADEFIHRRGLIREKWTTQISHYDSIAELCDAMKRINTILIDLCRDVWTYISMGYFDQKIVEKEVGSSAMPHKVNPIDFENAEGNLSFGNAIFEHIASKLPISRLQRDLTDSTTLRNLGVPFSHTLIAISSLNKGLKKITVNREVLEKDLQDNWAVVSEGVQTILRREKYPNPYEVLKEFTRGQKITQELMNQFIDSLNVSASFKDELKAITPFNYIGQIPEL